MIVCGRDKDMFVKYVIYAIIWLSFCHLSALIVRVHGSKLAHNWFYYFFLYHHMSLEGDFTEIR